jgi:hypothetical protein
MMRKVGKFLTLPWSEKILFVGTVFTLPLIEIGLRLFGFKRLEALIGKLVPKRAIKDGLSPEMISRIVGWAATNGFFRASCLRRSLMLWWLMKRRGFECEIKIGGMKDTDGFKAHAWVEWQGAVINDPVSDQYTVFNQWKKTEV